MAKKMTKELYEELNEAGKVLCKYCENNECSSCQVTHLMIMRKMCRGDEVSINKAECEEAVNEVCKMCFKKHEL